MTSTTQCDRSKPVRATALRCFASLMLLLLDWTSQQHRVEPVSPSSDTNSRCCPAFHRHRHLTDTRSLCSANSSSTRIANVCHSASLRPASIPEPCAKEKHADVCPHRFGASAACTGSASPNSSAGSEEKSLARIRLAARGRPIASTAAPYQVGDDALSSQPANQCPEPCCTP